MTKQAEELIGTRVANSDGEAVGTVQQIFYDDKDGKPVWARIRAGTRDRFVPLGGSRATKDGLTVPFGTQQILSGPEINAEQHISLTQTEQLNRHFGLTVPAQGGQRDAGTRRGDAEPGQARRGDARLGQAPRGDAPRGEAQLGQSRRGDAEAAEEWLIRAEERVNVGTERMESGRARLHKYVDVEPVERTVHVSHEECQIERVPITATEQVRGVIAEAEREMILHEERPVVRKETVPVERVRLVRKTVEEDRTLRDEIRRERVEIEADGNGGRRIPAAADPRVGNQRRP
jgi:uncharacterized protein (TIGR02271 family)